jgi:glycosyltransferase involved in cell wall biosynthesis
MRICSITPHQLLNNPRLVREADALADAGHDVRVIAVKMRPEQSARDDEEVRGRPWRAEFVNIEREAGRRAWLITGARQKLATKAWRRIRRGAYLAGLAYSRTFLETMRLATAEPADVIIAHTHPMLASAYFAARRLGCRWGFDCEDILSEEYGEGIDNPAHQALVRYVEATFIPRADYVTVASAEFSRWLTDHYGIGESTLVSNVPSLADAPDALRPGYPEVRSHLSLYWFSISVGPLRGIEDAIRALPLIDVPATLHVRGRMLPGFEPELRALIASLDLQDQVVVHDLIGPRDVVRAASDHDIGLVLTQPCCENHELAVPNKIYAYMMAGIAVGATATRGHRSAVPAIGDIGFEYQPGNHVEFAARVNALVAEPGRLRAAREEAFRLARSRYNWEIERGRLVERIARLEREVIQPAVTPAVVA